MLRNLKISAEKPKYYSSAHFYGKRANSMAWLQTRGSRKLWSLLITEYYFVVNKLNNSTSLD